MKWKTPSCFQLHWAVEARNRLNLCFFFLRLGCPGSHVWNTNANASARKWNFFHFLRRRLHLRLHLRWGSSRVYFLAFALAFALCVCICIARVNQALTPAVYHDKGAITFSLSWQLCTSQFQLRPSPPGQLRGICTHRQSRGLGISLPKDYPRAFDTRGFWLEIQTKTILSEKTSSLSLIGLSVKDWTKLWRFLKVCFLDFRHFLIVYQATTLKRDREK